MSDRPRVAPAKPVPTADDLRDMMEAIETILSELDWLRDRMRRHDMVSALGIGGAGDATLNYEIDEVRAAIEWLDLVFRNAEGAASGLLSDA